MLPRHLRIYWLLYLYLAIVAVVISYLAYSQHQAIREAAVHEAGHAVVAWYSGRYTVTHVTIDVFGGGATTYYSRPITTPAEAWSRCAVTAAGAESVRLLLGITPSGDEDDLNHEDGVAAILLVDQAIGEDIAPPWDAAWQAPVNATPQSFRAECAVGAHRILAAHVGAIQKIGAAVMDKRDLNHLDLTNLLGAPPLDP